MTDPDLLAVMFVRALLLNRKKGEGKAHMDIGVWCWEDHYDLDNENIYKPRKDNNDNPRPPSKD